MYYNTFHLAHVETENIWIVSLANFYTLLICFIKYAMLHIEHNLKIIYDLKSKVLSFENIGLTTCLPIFFLLTVYPYCALHEGAKLAILNLVQRTTLHKVILYSISNTILMAIELHRYVLAHQDRFLGSKSCGRSWF